MRRCVFDYVIPQTPGGVYRLDMQGWRLIPESTSLTVCSIESMKQTPSETRLHCFQRTDHNRRVPLACVKGSSASMDRAQHECGRGDCYFLEFPDFRGPYALIFKHYTCVLCHPGWNARCRFPFS